nr:hypothetical protein [uncultured Acidovorax sp.]
MRLMRCPASPPLARGVMDPPLNRLSAPEPPPPLYVMVVTPPLAKWTAEGVKVPEVVKR